MVTDRYLEFIHTRVMTETLGLSVLRFSIATNSLYSVSLLEHLLLLITVKSFSLDSHPDISFADFFLLAASDLVVLSRLLTLTFLFSSHMIPEDSSSLVTPLEYW